jgi:DNA repair protein RadA/Sms
MTKQRESIFVCGNCGNEFTKWQGQCSFCKEWNTLKELSNSNFQFSKNKKLINNKKSEIINLGKMGLLRRETLRNDTLILTGIKEFDRVLGKGIVRGSVVLFAGEPGIGKSTLLTQLIGKIGGLYVAGEESADQIAIRVKRLGLDAGKFDILATNSIEEVEANIERTKDLFKIAIVDSIQVMASENLGTGAGSVAQIKECAFRLVTLAKRTGMAIFVVGHVTKDGDIAGPKLLEHMVDTVIYFEGEKTSDLRILRVTKNRFGPTDEVGMFKMVESGLEEVRDLKIEEGSKIGSALTIVFEGNRLMTLEIQALVVESFLPMPKRIFSGFDYNRGQLLLAVAQKILGIPLYKYDVFIAVTGGIKIEDTGADLAVIEAIYSSYKEKPIGRSTISIGEVSLLGDIKKVRNWEKREKEAKGMGRKIREINNVRELKV